MAILQMKDMLLGFSQHKLPSKDNVDTIMTTEIKKPEAGTSGNIENADSVHEATKILETKPTQIIARVPDFHKEIGTVMSEEFSGFIQLPRSLLTNPDWISMSSKYQSIFEFLIEISYYHPSRFVHNGHSIDIGPGQVCISRRRFRDLYNSKKRFKKDHIDEPLIQRSFKRFFQFGFSIQETIHGITRHSIIQKDIFTSFNTPHRSRFDPDSIQIRSTNKEQETVLSSEIHKKETDKEKRTDESEMADCVVSKKLEELKEVSKVDSVSQILDQEEEKDKNIECFLSFCDKHGMLEGSTKCGKPGITKKNLIEWVSAYAVEDITSCLTLTKSATIQKSYPAYVLSLLKNKIPKRQEDIERGKKLVKASMEANNMTNIRMMKYYFVDDISGDQVNYETQEKTLKEILEKSYHRLQQSPGFKRVKKTVQFK